MSEQEAGCAYGVVLRGPLSNERGAQRPAASTTPRQTLDSNVIDGDARMWALSLMIMHHAMNMYCTTMHRNRKLLVKLGRVRDIHNCTRTIECRPYVTLILGENSSEQPKIQNALMLVKENLHSRLLSRPTHCSATIYTVPHNSCVESPSAADKTFAHRQTSSPQNRYIADMDLDSLKSTVSNLTLYDVKAGFRKAQNGGSKAGHKLGRLH